LSWEDRYLASKQLWGEKPSELAVIAVAYLKRQPPLAKQPKIVDIGCGYGRDAFYLFNQLKWPVIGIDTSETAINMAREALGQEEGVSFTCKDFQELKGESFDVVYSANLYHILHPHDREAFRETVQNISQPDSLLFLNALSTNDAQEYGKGTPVPGDPNSFVGNKYLHFLTKAELGEDFKFLTIHELYEHSYDEFHIKGPTHHHTSWILIGEFMQLV